MSSFFLVLSSFVASGFITKTHQIRQRIQLRAHQTTLLPPPCDLAIEKVEEQPKRHEAQREPEVERARGVDAVPHGGGDGHEAAEAVHEGDEVGEVVGADQTEVVWVGRVEDGGLFVFGWVGNEVLAGWQGCVAVCEAALSYTTTYACRRRRCLLLSRRHLARLNASTWLQCLSSPWTFRGAVWGYKGYKYG